VCGEDGTDDQWNDREDRGDEEERVVKKQEGRHLLNTEMSIDIYIDSIHVTLTFNDKKKEILEYGIR
jgi:hypothetical protein